MTTAHRATSQPRLTISPTAGDLSHDTPAAARQLSDSAVAVLLPPQPVSYRSIGGLPLIQRAALSAQRAGFHHVVALADGDAARLRALFDGDPRTRSVAIVRGGAAAVKDAAVLLPSDSLLDASGQPWLRVTNDTIALAEERLLDEIRLATAATDGPIARFDRHLSLRLSRRLARTRLRPNHLTMIGTALGLVAAGSFARGSHAGGLIGAWLFWLAVIIDGCDGEVARLTFRESAFGARLDVITDNVVHAAIFLGIGLGCYRTDAEHYPILLSTLLLSGFASALVATWPAFIRDRDTRPALPATPQRAMQAVLAAMMNRDFAYLLLGLALIDRLGWFLWGAAFGSWAYTAALLATSACDRRVRSAR